MTRSTTAGEYGLSRPDHSESQARSPAAIQARLSRTPGSRFSAFRPSRRDLCGESDLPAPGGSRWATHRATCSPPVAHQRQKRGGRSHHQHPSRAARRYAGRGGDTRGAASLRLFAADAGNPCCPASDAAFRGSTAPQRRGLRPLRERRCVCPISGPPRWAPPHLQVAHLCDAI